LAAGKAAFPELTLAQLEAAPKIDRIIDAHCHVFNAADLPIEGFARKIMIPKTAHTSELLARFAQYPGALEALVHAVTVQMKRGAPNLRAEVDAIDEFERSPSKEANERVAPGPGSEAIAKCVSAHLVQLGHFWQSRAFLA
jgi:hypothetical protein